MVNASASIARGIGGIKLKVGQPDAALDIARVTAVRKHLGDAVPIMVDANQQWDRPTAQRMCRIFEPFNLVWIEEPLDAYDHEGHAALALQFDTPIATGEMLTSTAEHAGLMLAPHFAMELHVHLAAAYPREPLFNERIEIKDGRMRVPTRPGLGLTLSEQVKAWTREVAEVGSRF